MDIDHLDTTMVDDARWLSRQAGWGLRRADWQLLLGADDVLALGGVENGELIATATVAQYDRLGWVGSVIVEESHRRRGLGSEIFAAACERSDAAVLGLDANPTGKPIYEEYGFATATTVEQFEGAPDPAQPAGVTPVTEDVSRLVEYDRRQVGVDRDWLLRALAEHPHTQLFAVEDPELEGYAALRADENGWSLGPVVAESPAATRDLVRRAAVDADGELTVRVPDAPTEGDVDWNALGFTRTRSLDRMAMPAREHPLAGGAVRAITSYALG